MDTTNSTSEYLLFFRGNDWDRSLSPGDMQKTVTAFSAWFERLSAHGIVKAGQALQESGRVVSGKNGRVVSDGPFAESKEAIGGYFMVTADSLEEAVEIAQDCPMLEYGVAVEVRPIAAICPTMQRVERRLAGERELAGV